MVCTLRKSDRGKMTSHAKMQNVIVYLDDFIFVKNGYSVCIHLIPFVIASLLLLTLSVPKDNLLLNLVEVLQQPSWIWLPAGLLTAVAAVIYFFTIKAQVRRAYLWSDGDFRRTVCTSLVYVILCTLMVYAVLMFISSYEMTLGTIWACLLVAVLSLTGIGWKRPSKWVDSIGIKSPNYKDGRASAAELTEILQKVRSKKIADKQYVEDKQYLEGFLAAAKDLHSNIETNLQIEPEWAKYDLERASGTLYTLWKQVETEFPTNSDSAVSDFLAVCRDQVEFDYPWFKETLEILSEYWPKWHYQKPM
jgi:hypothetical protein